MPSSGLVPVALADAVRDRRVLIFAGAGVSTLPPSSLPDWTQFNQALLEEIKATALRGGTLPSGVARSISSLCLGDVGMTRFSEAIVKIVTSEGYFPVLKALDSDQTNVNHRAIADLLRQGIVRGVVTTNFDTLIERACAEAGVPLDVSLGGARSEERESAAVHPVLHKVHGSVTDVTTLIDTVGQKLRGLPPQVRLRLASLFREYHVLVLGFSGQDLDFSPDYLSFFSIEAASPGVTWLVPPGVVAGKRVQQLVDRLVPRGKIVPAQIEDVLHQIGAAVVDSGVAHDEATLRQLANDRARARIHERFGQSSSNNALGFCMRLLVDAGRTDEALAVRTALVAEVDRLGDALPENDGPALRALAVTAELMEGPDAHERWTVRELRHLEQREGSWHEQSAAVAAKLAGSTDEGLAMTALPYPFTGRYDADGWRQLDRRVVEDLQRLQAGAWTNLALVYVALRAEGAGRALQRALDFCELSADRVSLAHMFYAYGTWCREAKGIELSLSWLACAEAAGVSAGNVDAANAAAIERADALAFLGEYDAALLTLARVRARQQFGLSIESQVEIERLAGTIAVRRGQFAAALTTFNGAMRIAGASASLAARTRWSIAAWLGFRREFREGAVSACDALLQAMDAGTIPFDGRLGGVPPRSAVELLRRRLKSGKYSKPPFPLPVDPAEEQEIPTAPALRRSLVESEFKQSVNRVLACLRQLAQAMYQNGRMIHALELADAQLSAASRAGEVQEQLSASWIRANTLQALGDRKGAREAAAIFQRAEFAGDALLAERVHRFLTALSDETPSKTSSFLRLMRSLTDNKGVASDARQLEADARDALEATEVGVARTWILEAMDGYRLALAEDGLRRGFELLAAAAALEGRSTQAEALRRKAGEYR